MLALVVVQLARPETRQHFQGFVEQGAAHSVVLSVTEVAEVDVGRLADTDSEDEPAPGEVVEGDRLAGQLGGAAPGGGE